MPVRRLLPSILLAVLTISATVGAAAEFSGRQSDWHGFTRFDFQHEGRSCIVVAPDETAAGRPWVWRARFFGHEPQADVALLKLGYHIVYCDVGNLFGSPQAVEHWNRFYELLTTKHGFAKKTALEGMSRGGLIIYNWAAANPEKVACLYGDAPVCDFKSWPGGKGTGKGSAGDWQRCLQAYGLTEEQALRYDRNPIDQLEPLAKAGIPILHVVGAADDVVPVAENTAVIEQRYRVLGGAMEIISKPGVGHHPHALKDPQPIVDFIVRHTQASDRLN
jgi:pimeloyl-ACP methyl ester carboxylesterase